MPSKSRPGTLENPGAESRDSAPPPTGEVARPDQVGELRTGARGDAVAAQRALAEAGAHNAQSAESGAQVDGGVPLANGGVPAEPGDAQPNPQLANMQLGQQQLGQMIASSMQAQNAFQVGWQASAQRQQTTSDQMVTALQHLGTLLSAPAPVHVPPAPAAAAPVPVLPALAAVAPRAERAPGAREDAPVAHTPRWGTHDHTLLPTIDENTNKLPDSFHNKTKNLTGSEAAEFKRCYKGLCRFDSWRLHLLDFLALDLPEEQRTWAVEWLWELGDIQGGDAGDTQGPMALAQARMAVLLTPANQRSAVEAYISGQDTPLDPMTLVYPGLAAMQATAVARDVTQQMRALAGARSKEAEDDALAAERLEAARVAGRARGGDDPGAARGRGGGRGDAG
ncbi:hypothetical protein T484DRAFT_1863032, partial [Baffinella frigidus]